jgi:hypothetical protein
VADSAHTGAKREADGVQRAAEEEVEGVPCCDGIGIMVAARYNSDNQLAKPEWSRKVDERLTSLHGLAKRCHRERDPSEIQATVKNIPPR